MKRYTFLGRAAFDYFVRTRKGKPYPIVCRCEKNTKKNVEIVLDVNEVAKDMKYCSLGGFKPSPTHDVLAYAVDSTATRRTGAI